MRPGIQKATYIPLDDEGTEINTQAPTPPQPIRPNRRELSLPRGTNNLSLSPSSSISSISATDFKLQMEGPIDDVSSVALEKSQDSYSAHSTLNSRPEMKEYKVSRGLSSPFRKPQSSPDPGVLDLDEEESIVAQIEDNPYRSQTTLREESHSEKLWKRNLYLLMEDPSSSQAAFLFNLTLAGVILFSVVLTTIETIPAVRELQWTIWSHLELLTVILFTIELGLRTAAHSGNLKNLSAFLKAPLTILDVLAVVPFYATLLFRNDTSVEFRFTILRVFRLFRLFRAYKYSSLLQLSIEVMLIAVRKSLDALGALFFFMVITIVLFSTFLYFAECGVWDAEKKAFMNGDGRTSTFDSIPAAFWFVIVTITTTGYGDIVPTTFLGKLIAFPLMMLGILLIALPSVIVGRNFTVVWDVLKRRRHSIDETPQRGLNRNESRQSLSEMMEGIELELATDPRVTQDGHILPRVDQTPTNHQPLDEFRHEILSYLERIQGQQDLLGIHLKALHDQSISNERQIALCAQLLAKSSASSSSN